jgi:hypothetical protein
MEIIVGLILLCIAGACLLYIALGLIIYYGLKAWRALKS